MRREKEILNDQQPCRGIASEVYKQPARDVGQSHDPEHLKRQQTGHESARARALGVHMALLFPILLVDKANTSAESKVETADVLARSEEGQWSTAILQSDGAIRNWFVSRRSRDFFLTIFLTAPSREKERVWVSVGGRSWSSE